MTFVYQPTSSKCWFIHLSIVYYCTYLTFLLIVVYTIIWGHLLPFVPSNIATSNFEWLYHDYLLFAAVGFKDRLAFGLTMEIIPKLDLCYLGVIHIWPSSWLTNLSTPCFCWLFGLIIAMFSEFCLVDLSTLLFFAKVHLRFRCYLVFDCILVKLTRNGHGRTGIFRWG